jgi:hypothetical protein
MSVLNKLASALNRRDEVPNQELAKHIADKGDKKAIEELAANLTNKSRDIQSDCIKVLYEIGERKPELVAPYAKDFIALLDSKNNRLQWGAMTAISAVASAAPKAIYAALPKIVDVAAKGSVITKDHCVKILVRLGELKQHNADVFPLLLEQLIAAPVNQFPSYAESALTIVNDKNKAQLLKTINNRLDDIEQESKRKRVEKVIKKLNGRK